MQYQLRAYTFALVLVLLAACGRDNTEPVQPKPHALGMLPSVWELPALSYGQPLAHFSHSSSALSPNALSENAIAFNALASNAMVHNSVAGTAQLGPAAGELAWGIFGVAGFPTDGSVSVSQVFIEQSKPCWVAFSDFGSGKWEVQPSPASGSLTPVSSDLISAGGVFYIAILGFSGPDNLTGESLVSSLKVETSAALPSAPTPSLTTISATGKLAAGVPSYFNASGSDPGTGASFANITYEWNDGSPSETSANPLDEVNHIWSTAGEHAVSLTVASDAGRSVTRNFTVTLTQPERSLLLVYNSDIPESVDLAAYYASSRNGRLIDPTYILGLPMGTDADSDFDRATYNALIRDPIKAHLDASSYKASIKYILLCKGVPHRIADSGGVEDGSASVDSELCTLYSDLGPGNAGYPYDGWLINGPHGLNMVGDGFYLKNNTAFTANSFHVCYDPTWQQPQSGDEVPFTLNYLVGRLSAYTYDEAKLLVDRSIAADTTGDGWTILDSSTNMYFGQPMNTWDTMVDPVFPWPNDGDMKSGYDLLTEAGYNAFADVSPSHVWSNFPTLPAGAADNVLAYCSWGTHAGQQPQYILDDLQFTYLPGACFMSYESYNAWNFDGDNLGNRNNQGQVCDFLRMGGTCAIGNAWEPYNLGIGDERWVFSRYIIKGDRWIEAAYKGLRLMSWMEVVVGDPLCKVK
jgi:uncharacterized protein (TIGR03790 family)